MMIDAHVATLALAPPQDVRVLATILEQTVDCALGQSQRMARLR
jgi:hypothetical protein